MNMGYCGSLNFVAAILAHTKTKEKSCLVPFIDHSSCFNEMDFWFLRKILSLSENLMLFYVNRPFTSFWLDSKIIHFLTFFMQVISLMQDKMVSVAVPCKSNRKDI
jgi:hypothetical protein